MTFAELYIAQPDKVTKLYEDAIQWASANRNLWLAYASWELSQPNQGIPTRRCMMPDRQYGGLASLTKARDNGIDSACKAFAIHERAIQCEALCSADKEVIYQAYLIALSTRGTAAEYRAKFAQHRKLLKSVETNERKRALRAPTQPPAKHAKPTTTTCSPSSSTSSTSCSTTVISSAVRYHHTNGGAADQ
jgi:hypothetical protein